MNVDILSTEERRDEAGASAVEYALLVAAIAAVIVIIVFAIGGIVDEIFTDTCDSISGEASSISASCA